MARNKRFNPERQPLRDHPSLRLGETRIGGPFSFLYPTQANYQHCATKSAEAPNRDRAGSPQSREDDTNSNVGYRWTSRNNRKGRHALTVKPANAGLKPSAATPRPTSHPAEVLNGITRMFVRYPVWDVSYLVAVIFTWGSIVWVVNAFFAFLPFIDPATAFDGETLYGGGITAFIGATIFEIGSVLLMLEAVNENRSGCFGWALENLVDDFESTVESKGRFVPADCSHHHPNKRNLVGKPGKLVTATTIKTTPPGTKSWVWWPSTHELRTHYIHDLGFIACSSQMLGATVFWISGFTALPGIYDHMSPGLADGVYWTPQVVGGCGFIVSGALFMIETQNHWWQPAPDVLGWHIGFWNLIGGIGFTICPCFGFDSSHWAQYQASCSTFWASWAFLIGSVIQWYESLDKYPVEAAKDEV